MYIYSNHCIVCQQQSSLVYNPPQTNINVGQLFSRSLLRSETVGTYIYNIYISYIIHFYK